MSKQQMHNKEETKSKTNRAKRLRAASTAFVGLILAGVLTWFFPPKQHIDANDLFVQNYQVYETRLMAKNGNSNDRLIRIEQLYQGENYMATMPLVDEYLNEHPDNTELKLVSGICALETGKYEEAVAKFSAIKHPLYEDKANWYKALTYLKKGDFIPAKKALKIVKNFMDSSYREKAILLLYKIEKMVD